MKNECCGNDGGWPACLPAWGFYDPLLRDGWNWIGAHSIAKVSIWGEERERERLNGSPNNWIDGIIGGAYRLSLSLVQLKSESMMAFNFVASYFHRPDNMAATSSHISCILAVLMAESAVNPSRAIICLSCDAIIHPLMMTMIRYNHVQKQQCNGFNVVW